MMMDCSGSGSGNSDDDFADNSNIATSSQPAPEVPNPIKTKGIKRRLGRYSVREGQLILDTICVNDAFLYTEGLQLWVQLEKTGFFHGRSCHSMKDHFQKVVLPRVVEGQVYQISAEDLQRLEDSRKTILETKHFTACPLLNLKKPEKRNLKSKK